MPQLQDPDNFCQSVEGEQQALRDKLTAATQRLPDVAISRDTKLKISEVLLHSHPAAGRWHEQLCVSQAGCLAHCHKDMSAKD